MAPFWVLLLLATAPVIGSSLPVRGRVIGQGRPLAGVAVSLLPAPSEYQAGELAWSGESRPKAAVTTQTRADGEFELEAPEASLWIVRAERKGFAPMELRLLPLAEATDLPTLDMTRGHRLEILVRSPTGKPLKGSRVLVGPARGFVAKSYFHLAWRAARQVLDADDSGKVTLNIAASPMRLEATAPSHEPAVVAASRARRTTIHLSEMPQREVLVRHPSKHSAPGVLIWAAGSELPIARTDSRGRAVVPWSPGEASPGLRLLAPDGAALRVQNLRRAAASPRTPKPIPLTLEKPRAIAGRVISLPDRKVLASAWVWQGGDPVEVVHTDPSGSYQLSRTPWASGLLRAGAPGFFTESRDVSSLAPNGAAGPTFALPASSAISGVVTDEEGHPLAGLEVKTRFERRRGDLSQVNPPLWERRSGGVAITRRDGRFRLGNLVPGIEYRMRVQADGFSPYEKEVTAPSRRGRPTSDLKLVLTPGVRAAGQALDPSNQPVVGARVTVEPAQPTDEIERWQRLQDDPVERTASTDSSGRFEVAGLPEGRIDLTVEAFGWATARVPGIAVERQRGVADLGTVILRREAKIVGRVQDGDGNPVSGATLTIVPDDPILALAASDGTRGSTEPDALSDSDGRFEIGGLARGQRVKLRVDCSGFGLLVLPAVRAGGDPVVATLSRTRALAGRVSGSDGSSISGALVRVDTLEALRVAGAQFINATRPSSLSGRSGEDGRFVLRGLDPGRLRLHVTASGWQSRTLSVTLPAGDEGASDELEVVLDPAATVVGLVRDADGEPVVGAEIRRAEPDPPPGVLSFRAPLATADGDGRYRVGDVEPGHLILEARHPELGVARGEIQALPGENHLDFQLEAERSLAGMVVDSTGTPVDGALITASSAQVSHDPPAVRSGAGGRFHFPAMIRGSYNVSASKTGLGRSAEPVRVDLADASVQDVVVELAPEARVRGTLYGLSFEELPRVRLQANDLVDVGHVRHDGSYEIDHLAPGAWTIVAELPGTGRQATGRASLDPEDPEAVLDLDFEAGLTLHGFVTLEAEPWPGAAVTVLDSSGVEGWAETDGSGEFEVAGLKQGRVSVEVGDTSGEIRSRRPVELDGDATVRIDVTLGVLEGTVVDAVSRQPIAGARVVVSPVPAVGIGAPARTAETSAEGAFAKLRLTTGRWRIQVSQPGYRTLSREIEIETGTRSEDLALVPLPAR